MGLSTSKAPHLPRPEYPAQVAWAQSYGNHVETKDKSVYGRLESGTATYGLQTELDRQSIYSDDTESVTGSIFDGESTVSSQSSYGSSESDSPDDSSDGENALSARTHARQSAAATASKRYSDHSELLSGLSSESQGLRYDPVRASERRQCPQPGAKYAHVHSTQAQPDATFKQPQHAPQKTNRRRSVNSDTAVAPPCKLKRDTESADCFVMLLITFAAKLITAIWPLSACPPMMSSCFNGAGVLPLEVFIHETLRRSKTSYSTLQVALWYLMLLKCKLPNPDLTKEQGASSCRAMQCGRRMFLAALMLASKYLQDRNYSTRAWSKISGLRICEINENEMKYLQTIDYRLHITKDVFDNWSRVVLSLSKLSKLKPGCPLVSAGSRLFGSSNMSSLSDMVDSDFSTPEAGAMFSDDWWRQLLATLDPSICETEAASQAFLRENLPTIDMNHPMLKMDQGSAPAFESPIDKSQAVFGNMSMPSMQSGSTTPAPSPESSGRITATLPLRPQPRNLPTPTSTPGGSTGPQWLATPQSSQMNLRCSASVDALRSVRKQCLANANLERCPPPRPQSYHAPLRSRMRPAESNPYQGYPTPSTTSPATSTMSDCSGRSRSSSISSNSSWNGQAVPNLPCTSSKLASSTTISPLTRVVSMPETRVPEFDNMRSHPLRRKPQFSDISAARLATAQPRAITYDALREAQSSNLAQENDAAEALLRLRVINQQVPDAARQSSHNMDNSPRGHKRTISSTAENMQGSDEDTHMLQERADAAKLTPTTYDVLEKNWQKPSRGWAMPKKPVLTFDHKRMAMYCTRQGQLSAPDLASLLLKEQLVSA